MLLAGILLMFMLASGYAGDENCSGRDTMETRPEQRLFKSLMCDYSRSRRPVKDHTKTVDVTVQLNLKYLKFDESEEFLTVSSWMGLVFGLPELCLAGYWSRRRFEPFIRTSDLSSPNTTEHWIDQFLTWDPDKYDGLKQIQIDSFKLWQPHLALYNPANGYYWATTIFTPCLVTHTGLVRCTPHVARTAICATRLRGWPYDTQNCTMRFGSWLHTGDRVNFRFGALPVAINDYLTGPGWALLKIGFDRSLGHRLSSPGDTYPELRYHFVLERLAAGPAAVVVVPSVAVVLLPLCSLLLDYQDSRRLSIASFGLLGHFFFLAQINYDLPKHSSDTPVILLFLRGSMVLNLLGILMTLLLACLRKCTVRPYFWVTKVNGLFLGSAKFVVFTEFEPSQRNGKIEETADSSAEGSSAAANSEWCSFCNILNSVTFVVLLVVYFIFILCYLPRQVVTSVVGMQPDAKM